MNRTRHVIPGPEYDVFRAAVRRKRWMVTPFRLGMAVGDAGADLPSPYPPGSRGTNCYLSGLAHGRARYEKFMKEAA
jgi:hypothetical protein